MKNKIISLIVTISLLTTNLLRADIPSPESEGGKEKKPIVLPSTPKLIPGEQDIGNAISPMKKGQIAPFTGLLLSPSATASIISDIQFKDQLIQIEVKKATSTMKSYHDHELEKIKIRNESDSQILSLRLQEQAKEINRLDLQLKEERESRPNPATWVSIGVVGGVILSTLTAAVIVSVVNNN